MQAFSHIPCDTDHRRPVNLLTGQKFSQNNVLHPSEIACQYESAHLVYGCLASRHHPSIGPTTS
jgi:hypothetical protein